MACHCVTWTTGEPVCIGIIGDSSIARCRTECRLRGMGVLCHSGFGDCNGDNCSGGALLWRTVLDVLVTASCIGGYQSRQWYDLSGPFFACRDTIPTTPAFPSGFMWAYDSDWIYDWPSWAMDAGGHCQAHFTVEVVGYYDWIPYIHGGRTVQARCSVQGPLKTPCCYPDPAHPGSTLCAFITPAECLQRCGQFFEGTLGWADSDPCRLTGDAHPCNIRPCCRQYYPHPPDIDYMGGSSEYGSGGKYCRNGTLTNCNNWVGSWNRDARSCYASESCDRVWVDDLHCVRGDWALTYRPSSTPPLMKRWIEGSAEIVSEKPERAMMPAGGPQDCKNHYGDVVYPFVEHGRPADAMGAICSTRASGVIDPGHACRRYYEQDLCPVFYGPDGNARFRCEYRVA